MRDRAGLMILLALVAGGLAAYLAFKFLRSPEAPEAVRRTSETVSVVVASRSLEVGATIESEDVRVIDWPGTATPEGYAQSADEVVGRGVLQSIHANEPVLPFKLASPELGRGLAMVIPEGFRAVSIPVDPVTAVDGWVRQGTRVDLIVTLDDLPNQSEPITQIVLQNVEVLGNDRVISRDQSGEAIEMRVVTVLVDPEDAERLSLAQQKGSFQLALRNALDLELIETPGVRTSQLLRLGAPPPVRRTSRAPAAAPAPPTRNTIDVYRGPTRTEVEMPGGGGR